MNLLPYVVVAIALFFLSGAYGYIVMSLQQEATSREAYFQVTAPIAFVFIGTACAGFVLFRQSFITFERGKRAEAWFMLFFGFVLMVFSDWLLSKLLGL